MTETKTCESCGAEVNFELPYVRWNKPRRFVVKMYGDRNLKNNGYGQHETLGVVAYEIGSVIRAAQKAYPLLRVESVVDTGAVDIVIDFPVVD